MTPAEEVLWNLLRSQKLGAKFRRQHPFGCYVLDFFCYQAGLAIELDGPCHLARRTRDRYRDRWLEAHGLVVLRFANREVLADPQQVLRKIRRLLEALPWHPPWLVPVRRPDAPWAGPSPEPPLPEEGEGAGGEGS